MGEMSGMDDLPYPFTSIPLSEHWEFKQSDRQDGSSWMPVKTIPSTVHQDLIDNQKLDDPFFSFNELKAEWVGTKSWRYRTSFTGPRLPSGVHVFLAFDGLDTFASVKLNGSVILQSDNMFVSHKVDVTKLVRGGGSNELEVEFEPALLEARKIMAKHPDHKYICSNGESARLAARKAQYHWGWDWGPILMSAGIWRPVRLESYETKVTYIAADIKLTKGYQRASIDVSFEVEHYSRADVEVEISLKSDGQSLNVAAASMDDRGIGMSSIDIQQPKLWMPNGYGDQTMYVVEVTARSRRHGITLHTASRRIGIRECKLIQEPDKHGKSFYFRINGVDIFCGGSCWIPADSFLTNVTPERYRKWIKLMVAGNQKMIRVWGGGIYEDDAFYDACDELGILVWQDFMFACGNYPTFTAMLESIKLEAVQNVRRLRNHPSIVIFAGNNEDYQIQEQSGLKYDYDDKNEQNWLKTDFPARFIYESLLPGVMKRHAPSIPYHPGSPWGDGKPTSDPTIGDMHQWNVWHGTQEMYQIYDTLGGRFNSEFGMEAFPHLETIKSFVENESELYPQSQTLDFHNKAAGHERRIATYMVENVRIATDLKAYTHLTQLIQSEALMFGYRGWRKQWGDNRKCGGALVWQLNDCWPVISWSICDYYLRPKPAYYAMARTLAPIAVGIKRAHHDWSIDHARIPKKLNWEVWAVSSKLEEIHVDVEVRFVSVESGRDIKQKLFATDVRVSPNGTTRIAVGEVDNVEEEPHVLAARLFVNRQIVARDTDWPQPLKYLNFRSRNIRARTEGDRMYVSAERPIKCVVFEEREGCRLSDNALDVVPRDEQVITVSGLTPSQRPLKWTYLGQNEQ